MNRLFVIIFTFFMFPSCEESSSFQKEIVDRATENGKLANQGFSQSLKFVNGWLTKTDSNSGLIPTNLTKSIHDSGFNRKIGFVGIFTETKRKGNEIFSGLEFYSYIKTSSRIICYFRSTSN